VEKRGEVPADPGVRRLFLVGRWGVQRERSGENFLDQDRISPLLPEAEFAAVCPERRPIGLQEQVDGHLGWGTENLDRRVPVVVSTSSSVEDDAWLLFESTVGAALTRRADEQHETVALPSVTVRARDDRQAL